MTDIPDPSKITPKKITESTPINDQKPKAPTKRFGAMVMTEEEYKKVLNGMAKTILDYMKSSEKRMIKALKKMREDSE